MVLCVYGLSATNLYICTCMSDEIIELVGQYAYSRIHVHFIMRGLVFTALNDLLVDAPSKLDRG